MTSPNPKVDHIAEVRKPRSYRGRERYTKELLEPLVAESITVSDVLRKLGLLTSGNQHAYISKRIRDFGINTSHFCSRNKFNSLRISKGKIPADKMLILRDPKEQKIPGHRLRRALIEIGRAYECEECGQGPAWNGKKLTIQVDHKNGKWWDNRPTNLRFLCPNCHTQTENFCAKNRVRQVAHKACEKCFSRISPRAVHCRKCRGSLHLSRNCGPRPRKVANRPSSEELQALIDSIPMVRIGNAYGVSDNAVRKWAKGYGIVLKSKKTRKKICQQPQDV